MGSPELGQKPEETLSPSKAFEDAVQKLQSLDPNIVSISSPDGAIPIHAIFEEIINNPALNKFRADEDGSRLKKIVSPDAYTSVFFATDSGMHQSGIKTLKVDTQTNTTLFEKVSVINEVNGGKHGPRNDASHTIIVEDLNRKVIKSVFLETEVSPIVAGKTQYTEEIKDPQALIEIFSLGLEHAKGEFTK